MYIKDGHTVTSWLKSGVVTKKLNTFFLKSDYIEDYNKTTLLTLSVNICRNFEFMVSN